MRTLEDMVFDRPISDQGILTNQLAGDPTCSSSRFYKAPVLAPENFYSKKVLECSLTGFDRT